MRDDFTAAVNARLVPRVEFGVDHRGWSMFDAINRQLTGTLTGQRAVVTPTDFGGVAQAPQAFRTPAAIAGGRPAGVQPAEMSDRISTSLADPITQALLARSQAS